MNKTKYIFQLPVQKQKEILSLLEMMGISQEDIDRALNSRLCDLEDTIGNFSIC